MRERTARRGRRVLERARERGADRPRRGGQDGRDRVRAGRGSVRGQRDERSERDAGKPA
jgi:hypothetical protein